MLDTLLTIYLAGVVVRLVYGLVHIIKYEMNIDNVMASAVVWPVVVAYILYVSIIPRNTKNAPIHQDDIEVDTPVMGFKLGTTAWRKNVQGK